MKYQKKLIEVALPLDDINIACVREKSIRHGHPSTLHLWWARRPLAAARAVLFAQLVNDPGGERGYGAYPGQTKADAQKERERLFDIIRELVKWENITNEKVLEQARAEIRKSWAETCKITGEDPNKMPPFLDPFAGGGSIPLEAQRLGLETYASDLNPVAVMINKAQIEIPPKFSGRRPVGPIPSDKNEQQLDTMDDWSGTKGLATDVRRYGRWMLDEASKRIGHLYPQVDLPKDQGGGKGTVIAWIWVRTVASPNPAYNKCHVPLASTFWLSNKQGKEVWIEPIIDKDKHGFRFEVRTSKPKDAKAIEDGTKTSRGANFKCILSGVPISPDYIKSEGKAGRMGVRLVAVAAEGNRKRIFVSPDAKSEKIAESAKPSWKPDNPMPKNPRWFSPPDYGMPNYSDIFTRRQLTALTTFSDLVSEARQKVIADATSTGLDDDSKRLNEGGTSVTAYADAVAVYLAFAVDRSANYWSALTMWGGDFIVQTFGRQALPMVWDFCEANPFSSSTGHWMGAIEWVCRCLENLSLVRDRAGFVFQQDAAQPNGELPAHPIISTDPPYYDNVGYADLSDFFYVWMRRALRQVYPAIFTTVLTPKSQELIASPYRHGGKDQAEKFFVDGIQKVFENLAAQVHSHFPLTIYYAFKQSEESDKGIASTGWETFLSGVLKAGFQLSGTWPMRTERDQGLKTGTNVLASSIILVCRKRPVNALTVSRKQFLRELEESLPDAIEAMIGGTVGASPIAPVDLAQAAIGPGMAVYSEYSAVLEADGTPMTIHTVLTLINKTIEEYFTHAESDMDSDTRFCVDWFQQYGFKAGPFGVADVLARAKGTSVDGLKDAGVIDAGAGKVRLLKVSDYPVDWNPQKDTRTPIWEACHQMSRALRVSESQAGELLAKMPEKTERIRQLAYRLYTLCEQNKWAEEARIYNELIVSWHPVSDASLKIGHIGEQAELNI